MSNKQYKTEPSINWDHVSKAYTWMATNEDGRTWLFQQKPKLDEVYWWSNGDDVEAEAFSSFSKGTCNWENSLVQRPNIYSK